MTLYTLYEQILRYCVVSWPILDQFKAVKLLGIILGMILSCSSFELLVRGQMVNFLLYFIYRSLGLQVVGREKES